MSRMFVNAIVVPASASKISTNYKKSFRICLTICCYQFLYPSLSELGFTNIPIYFNENHMTGLLKADKCLTKHLHPKLDSFHDN